jgi:ribosomal protein S18 acetylase RimI-like enzyme
MQSIKIRQAGLQDSEIVADISRKTFYDSFAQYNTPENMEKYMGNEFSSKRLRDEVASNENIFLLAYSNEQLAGYAKLSESSQPTELDGEPSIEICRIYSTLSMIGKGIGKSLMEEILGIAKRRGKKLIWLGVWEHNPRAISFYSKWGFEKFGEHPFILGDEVQTDWLMNKSI